ncbi:MAG: diphosphomevalonate decarboxylase [Armatimonadetes bacterium]|nr:diphosphomevalonate decarboxylase [Anaerolineae bacterium]
MSATSKANANIAFIKYWGNQDSALRLPVNPSLSMNLDGVFTRTTVTWATDQKSDTLLLNGTAQTGMALQRVSQHLDLLRARLGITGAAAVESANNFPMGTGIASSASSFAALTVAAVAAAGLTLSERELTTLARIGSGSAARSVPTGFVEWYTGDTHEASYAESIAAPTHWDLVDVIAIVSEAHKAVGSKEGHETAHSSDLQLARVHGAAERLRICKTAIMARDFATFAEVVEQDSNLMHAVMMTSRPPLFYWLPATLSIMQRVRAWRADGLNVCYTLDAGPNVHCICTADSAEQVRSGLAQMPGVQEVRSAAPGGGATLEA